jgi:iron-sulfur cluster repair protein YtfE (RIC family)
MSEFQSITSYLMFDHDRLDAILYEVFALVAEGELEPATGRFAGFHAGMKRHLRLEEEILFPEFERWSGGSSGPTDLARKDHALIREALEEMKDALAAREARAFFAARKKFLSVLPAHHAQEEQLLYPLIDAAMTEEDRRAIVARLRGDE